jgi:hypothetical protein
MWLMWLKFEGAEIIFDLRSVAAVRNRFDSRNENLLLGIERSTLPVSRISPILFLKKEINDFCETKFKIISLTLQHVRKINDIR